MASGRSIGTPGSVGAHVSISEAETRQLRLRLETEITWLSRQMEELRAVEQSPDLSLIQTYREMIFSRRALLGRIPR
ncbi:hypothetical protein PVT68_12470 [Microbulbifer bruguierae]|uniref:Uncharacterized protein n=1 Tax=Microbulbifer bruguierae TaxID=3029061 RepID=A0ABY8N9X2_9GAMM|nr:hypothetical protein [Microbulbifer bruguierae]WGL15583.1 hypothetical protein PVT68_12470 [Microbulbifer bruguierae]